VRLDSKYVGSSEISSGLGSPDRPPPLLSPTPLPGPSQERVGYFRCLSSMDSDHKGDIQDSVGTGRLRSEGSQQTAAK
jgi:hypothetical protein